MPKPSTRSTRGTRSDQVRSKLPGVRTSIFTIMSRLARRYGAINLSQGFPDFDCDPKLKRLVTKYMQAGKNQYAPMAGVEELRTRLSEKIGRLYGYSPDPDREITITAGATQAIFTAIGCIVHPGDEVIIIEPAYDSYGPSVQAFGGVPVPVAMDADFRIDWDTVENAISGKTRMLIINNPHNPSGQILTNADLETLSGLANRFGFYVLSDEVYEHLVYDRQRHHSVIGYQELFQRSFATFSFGKVFHNTGWKIGFCAAPEHLMREFRNLHQFNVFSVNTPMQYAIAEYLEEPEVYLSLGPFFQEKRDYFKALMKASRFDLLPSAGSYFMLARYNRISEIGDIEFAQTLTRDAGVACIPISPFYTHPPPGQHIVRFCYAKTNPILEAAAGILTQV